MMLPLPFDRAYWVRPGLLAGCYPGSKKIVECKRMAVGLIRCGVSHCINLMELEERDRFGNPFVSYEPFVLREARTERRIVTFSRHAIKDCSIPTTGEMQTILDEIDSNLTASRTVYLHCWGGRGRTGTVVGCDLIRHGLATPEMVVEKLAELTAHNAAVFRRLPETMAQEDFLCNWEPCT